MDLQISLFGILPNPMTPYNIQFNQTGNNIDYVFSNDSLHEFVIHNGSDYLTPKFVSQIGNQNLHGVAQAYYVRIYPEYFEQGIN